MANCRTCGAEVVWAVTNAGKRIPLDPEPVKLPPGLFLFDNGYAKPPPELRQSHFASCPDADEHRKPKDD